MLYLRLDSSSLPKECSVIYYRMSVENQDISNQLYSTHIYPLNNALNVSLTYFPDRIYRPINPLTTLSEMLVRGASFTDIEEEVNTIVANTTNDVIEELVVLMFKTRDIRGTGERRLFHMMFSILYATYPHVLESTLGLVPKYGYWKDLFYIACTNYRIAPSVMVISYKQLLVDELALSEGRPISLFAKWMPREGKQMGRFAKEFANYIYGIASDMSHSQRMSALRHRISKLNAALKTVETYTCANRWDEIDPRLVPKIAAKKGRAAFLNEGFCPTGLNIRYPNNTKRMICRDKFQNFIQSEEIHDSNEETYEDVRSQVRTHFTGLNE